MKETYDGNFALLERNDGHHRADYKKSVKSLAEAIILQSMEDFWGNAYREESIEFFKGEGFRVCAEIAGMGQDDQSKVLEMLSLGGEQPFAY
ncbi:MAG: hypothetical protein M0Z75_15720 [Nitrospiraceae bacterium]|nr:hypothetical protein [Nitrospiraceae bacterium]MDA8089662.1 hypothetical protein [Nitrospiraceae bacterium]